MIQMPRRRAAAVFAGALAATPHAALAQSAAAPSAASTPVEAVEVIGARRATLELDTVSDTGSRLGLTPLETPASIQVIPGELIRRHGDVTLLEAEQRATGLTAIPTPGNGGTALAARGFTGVASVQQLYDGLQLYVGSGTVTFPVDTWQVDRLEVLSGPSSVLYGTGAIGGTVNVVSKTPAAGVRALEAQVGGGSFSTFRGAFDANGGWGDRLSYRIAASTNRSDGWIDRGDSDSTAVTAALRFDATPNLVFILSDDFGDQNPMRYYGDPVINGRAPEALREVNYNVLDAEMHFQDNWAQLKTEWTPLTGLKVRNTLYNLTTDRRWRNEENFAYQPATGRLLRNGYLRIKHAEEQYGDHLDLAWKGRVFGLENDLSFGGEANRIRFQNTSNSPFPASTTIDPYVFDPGLFISGVPVSPVFTVHTDQRAGFVEDRIKLTPQISLIGGARYDRYELTRLDRRANVTTRRNFDTVSWRAGAVYQPQENVSLYFQYSQATDPVSSLITLSPAQQIFDLTTGKQFEAGVKAIFLGGRGQATLAGYEITKNNLLAPVPGNPTVSQQIGQQSSRGVEVQASLDLGRGVTVEANGTVLNAQFDAFAENVSGVRIDRSGNRPPNVPEATANLYVTWRATDRLELRGGMRYVGERFSNNANTLVLPDYVEADFGVRYQITSKVFGDLRIYNGFDEFYAQSSYNSGTQWMLGRPRTVEFVLNGRF